MSIIFGFALWFLIGLVGFVFFAIGYQVDPKNRNKVVLAELTNKNMLEIALIASLCGLCGLLTFTCGFFVMTGCLWEWSNKKPKVDSWLNRKPFAKHQDQ